jgi:hypothetical protein
MLAGVERQSLHAVEDLSLLGKDDIDSCATFTLGMKSKLKHAVALIKRQLQQAGGDFDSQSQSVSGFDTLSPAEDDHFRASSDLTTLRTSGPFLGRHMWFTYRLLL